MFIILAFVTVLFASITFKNIGKLDYSLKNADFNLHTPTDIIASFLNGVDANFSFIIDNPTNQNFSVDSLNVDIYSKTGQLIAKSSEVLKNIKIIKNGKTQINFSYNIDVLGFYKMLDVHNKTDLIQMFNSYIENDVFGKEVNLKGYIKEFGTRIKFNTTTLV